MPQSAEFLAPRPCFVPPIPELDHAADLLSEAADCLLSLDYEQAREKLRLADIQAVFAYASRIMGQEDRNIHRRRPVSVQRPVVGRTAARMPSSIVAAAMYKRDGCRFCGCRVVLKEARVRMRAALPGAISWGETKGAYHAALYALSAVPDHVVPHAYGGGNDLDNVVTTCWPCNFGRNSWSLEEVGLLDPRTRPPVVDGWDGLSRLSGLAKTSRSLMVSVSDSMAPTGTDALENRSMSMLPSRSPAKGPFADTWFAEIDRIHAGVSGRLLAFVESCADLGVSYGINKVMIIRMQVGNIMIQPFGIEANGEVSIPWFIAGKKKEFRHFAHLVADAIPGTYARDTAKQWVVRMADRKVDVLEFLGASEAILAALPGLNASLRNSDSPLVVD